MSSSDYPHLHLTREKPITDRRPAKGFGQPRQPEDPRAHGSHLQRRLDSLLHADPEIGGYDARRLVRLHLDTSVPPEEIVKVAKGIEVVSQEDKKLVLAFATDEQLVDFRRKLGGVAEGTYVTYRQLIYALRDLDQLTPEDRTRWSLNREGIPQKAVVTVDVELWPLASAAEMNRLRKAFERWLEDNGGEAVDSVRKPYLCLYRTKSSSSLVGKLLRHRDVRLVDLPPRVMLDRRLRGRSVQELEEVRAPPSGAPGVVVLDSGIASGHPVLAPAVGDSQSFLTGSSAADDNGHGTLVAGITLYGDVAKCVEKRRFVPDLTLYSGRILDERVEGDARLIENQVEEAVRYFVDNYGCKVFNLSYGDRRKPYHGRHVRGLAVTLDSLSRELGVLFVVPTGNLDTAATPADRYPRHLHDKDATLIDPAPALNALTIGSLARYDRDPRWPDDPGYAPVARAGQPSPFTRHGPSVNEAIKPDLVDYGGNELVDHRTGLTGSMEVGELSTSLSFASGMPFETCSGTSFAAPRVSNLVATMLVHMPEASVDLCRALLAAHAEVPPSCEELCSESRIEVRHVAGYGRVDRTALFRSLDNCVTLWAMDLIGNKSHQFYEIPIPADYWSSGRRSRKMTVALAYRSPVQTTRVDYRAVKISFSLVQSDSVEQVVRSFNAETARSDAPAMPERSSGRSITAQVRSRGTVQASSWEVKQPSEKLRQCRWVFVVTRNDPAWGGGLSSEREEYALAVVLADRQAEQARLYAQIQTTLRTRLRARASRPS